MTKRLKPQERFHCFFCAVGMSSRECVARAHTVSSTPSVGTVPSSDHILVARLPSTSKGGPMKVLYRQWVLRRLYALAQQFSLFRKHLFK